MWDPPRPVRADPGTDQNDGVRLPSKERYLQQGIHALQAGRYDEATHALSRALGEESSFTGHMARARAYQKLGKTDLAQEQFQAFQRLKDQRRKGSG